jgi:hypothetical protein
MTQQATAIQSISHGTQVIAEQVANIDIEIDGITDVSNRVSSKADNLLAAAAELKKTIVLQQEYTSTFVNNLDLIRQGAGASNTGGKSSEDDLSEEDDLWA